MDLPFDMAVDSVEGRPQCNRCGRQLANFRNLRLRLENQACLRNIDASAEAVTSQPVPVLCFQPDILQLAAPGTEQLAAS